MLLHNRLMLSDISGISFCFWNYLTIKFNFLYIWFQKALLFNSILRFYGKQDTLGVGLILSYKRFDLKNWLNKKILYLNGSLPLTKSLL